MSVKRTTHTWLQPLYNNLDGITKNPFGVATSVHGFYGQTGIPQISTGTASLNNATGGSGMLWYNGGSGAFYNTNDIVLQLKNLGILKR